MPSLEQGLIDTDYANLTSLSQKKKEKKKSLFT